MKQPFFCPHCNATRRQWAGGVVIAVTVVAMAVGLGMKLAKRAPLCDPDWPVYQCNGTPETNSPRCCP